MTIAALVAKAPLRQNMTGDSVKLMQLALRDKGYQLSGTGFFGPATDTAVESFQKLAGLPVTGVVDVATANAIDSNITAHGAVIDLALAKGNIARPLWLMTSLSHIGLKEGPGATDNKELLADLRTVAKIEHDETPWCAGWVSFCLADNAIKPSSQPLWARSYADGWGIKLAGPAVGAIAVKTRTGGGHVTIVAGRTRSGALACCGGNQNDMVNVSTYAADAFNLGFFWPKGVPLPALIGMSHLPIVSTTGKVLSEA